MSASDFAGLVVSVLSSLGLLGIIQAAVAVMVTVAVVRMLLDR